MHESPIVDLGGIPFDLSIIIMTIVTLAVVIGLAVAGTRNMSVENPGKMQNFLEWIVEFVQNLIGSAMDMKKGKAFTMLGITLIMFIFVGNMLGLPFGIATEVGENHHGPVKAFGLELKDSEQIVEEAHEEHKHVEYSWWKSPTADVGMTMGLAIMIIGLAHFLGITRNTKGYFHHYFEPHWAMFPLNLIKEVSKLLTLGLRLFGNIFAGEVMLAVILMAGAWGIPALLAWQGFSIFVGAIQAFVFTMLTMVYISQNITSDH